LKYTLYIRNEARFQFDYPWQLNGVKFLNSSEFKIQEFVTNTFVLDNQGSRFKLMLDRNGYFLQGEDSETRENSR
jgi:hypothetical protein